jgi:hypothetical protein
MIFEVLDRKYSPGTEGDHGASRKISHLWADIWDFVLHNRKQKCCHSYGDAVWDKAVVLGVTIKKHPVL